jgi:hypothetical protein
MNPMHKGLLLIVVAPLIFVLSMLFLPNTLVNLPESLLYRIGQIICFVEWPTILLFDVVICIRSDRKRKAFEKTLPVEVPPQSC